MMQDEVLFDSTVPAFVRGLENLERLFKKALDYAKESGTKPEALLTARLYPDMFSFVEQVGYAYFAPLDFVQALVPQNIPEMSYDEKTFEELAASVAKVVAYLKKLTPKDFAGAAHKAVPIYFDPSQSLPAPEHAKKLALPNFYFHCAMSYGILRHSGVPIGKVDFLGPLTK